MGTAILIVDDSPSARMIAKRCLQIAGQGDRPTFEAEHGRAALDLMKTQEIGLVVSDLNMPVMDGRTLIRFMRSSPRLHTIPVLVISSLVNPVAEDELRAMGATHVLKKPINPKQMVDAIQIIEGAA